MQGDGIKVKAACPVLAHCSRHFSAAASWRSAPSETRRGPRRCRGARFSAGVRAEEDDLAQRQGGMHDLRHLASVSRCPSSERQVFQQGFHNGDVTGFLVLRQVRLQVLSHFMSLLPPGADPTRDHRPLGQAAEFVSAIQLPRGSGSCFRGRFGFLDAIHFLPRFHQHILGIRRQREHRCARWERRIGVSSLMSCPRMPRVRHRVNTRKGAGLHEAPSHRRIAPFDLLPARHFTLLDFRRTRPTLLHCKSGATA